MTSIREEAARLKRTAHAGPIGKRHSSFELYELLAECLALAHRCKRDQRDRADLEQLFIEQSGGSRRYVEKGSDEFILVCRYVFPTGSRSAERSNASRYAFVLREATNRRIHSSTLCEWLKTQGGLNALYMHRPLTRTTVKTKSLRLTQSIEVPKEGCFTVTLVRTGEGAFDVISVENKSVEP